MRGTVTATLSGGSFRVSDDKKVCTGSYDSLDTSPTISMVVQCDDGKKVLPSSHVIVAVFLDMDVYV